MKAVTCPQCGSLISKISEHQNIVQCDYCGARVIVAEQTPLPPKPLIPVSFDEYQSPSNTGSPRIAAIIITSMIVIVIATILLFAPGKRPSTLPPTKPVVVTAPTFSPPAKPEKLSVLEFGGKGTSAGLFDNPGEITVDGSGHIYTQTEIVCENSTLLKILFKREIPVTRK